MLNYRAAVMGLVLAACSSGGGGNGSAGPANDNPPPATPAAPTPTALVVLGDSLSDVGNAAAIVDYALGVSITPPTVGFCNAADVLVGRDCADLFYRRSRVSDGPVAVEHVAAYLGVELAASLHLVPSRPVGGTNYAVASATARGSDIADLARQVEFLLADRQPLDDDAVYLLIIGGNDALDALQATVADLGSAATIRDAVVGSAVAAIEGAVRDLLDFGARHIVVANVPDLATVPAVRLAAGASSDEAAVLAAAAAISDAFDRLLRPAVEDIGDDDGQWTPAPSITVFDLRAAWERARQAVSAAGGNADDACFDSNAYRDSVNATRTFHPECAPPDDGDPGFARFAYWDPIHPTSAAHAAIGADLVELLRN
jgi:phospholipase/lecithinase/hemolysin